MVWLLDARYMANPHGHNGLWILGFLMAIYDHVNREGNSNREVIQTKKDGSFRTPVGLPLSCHSQTLSRYRTTRGLLPAEFPPWAGSPLLRRPGEPVLRQILHIGAVLSVDVRSTCTPQRQGSRPREIPPPSLQVVGLQVHTTTPGWPDNTLSDTPIKHNRKRV